MYLPNLFNIQFIIILDLMIMMSNIISYKYNIKQNKIKQGVIRSIMNSPSRRTKHCHLPHLFPCLQVVSVFGG
jgi:hypothetical protein